MTLTESQQRDAREAWQATNPVSNNGEPHQDIYAVFSAGLAAGRAEAYENAATICEQRARGLSEGTANNAWEFVAFAIRDCATLIRATMRADKDK